MSADIVISQVSKQFRGGALALQDVSLQVEDGDFVSLLGPSGCGKSTLLKMIAGLTLPSSGTIAVDGILPANARQLMSFIFQDPTLLPWRTVEENVGLGLELGGMAAAPRKAKVEEMLELVGLTAARTRYPRQLSGGMKMRVSIARALASRPSILLLDEPFAALDEMTRDRLNDELLRLYAERQQTMVFVTHSVAEAVFLSRRIVILAPHPGRVAHIVTNDLPWPRPAGIRLSAEFDAQAAYVSRLLRGVHAEAPSL
ncbi:MAG: ABC transporter ATP-binding protein [Bryobacteraceae bacterium]|nr:ABC transporter ATP-binding protein [Bryobacteraceae bacterium]